jgi:hypothetical protein
MSDVIYRVAVELSTKGDLSAQAGSAISKLGGVDAAAKGATQSASTLATSLGHALESVADRAISVATSLATIGAGGAFAAATYGVLKVNNELEKTKISIAAIFGANGLAKDIPEGMDMATEIMAKMRKDAAALPGEFKDLTGIFKTISVPGFQAGASPEQVRELSSKTMAAGAVVGLPMPQTGRELAMLLEGRAGAHNVLGLRLAGLGGDKAAAFNKLAPEKRFEAVSKELDKWAPVIEAYKHSFAGLSSTLKDNVKGFLGQATSPLFEHIKSSLEGANNWFDTHGDKVAELADRIGGKLGAAWDWVIAKAKALAPIVEHVAGLLKEHSGAALGGAALGVGALKFLPGLLSGKGLLSGLVGAVGAAPVAIGALAIAGAGKALADPDSPSHAQAVAAVEEIGGSIGRIVDTLRPVFSSLLTLGEHLGTVVLNVVAKFMPIVETIITALEPVFTTLLEAVTPLVDVLGGALADIFQILAPMVKDAMDALSPILKMVADEVKDVAAMIGDSLKPELEALCEALKMLAESAKDSLGIIGAGLKWTKDHHIPLSGFGAAKFIIDTIAGNEDPPAETKVSQPKFDAPARKYEEPKDHTALLEALKRVRSKDGAGGGGGGVHIDKVEVTIAESHDPNRMARVVGGYLSDLARFRKSSPHVTNFSAAR